MPPWLRRSLLAGVEALTAAVPRPRPPAGTLADCRIVSHRGERDNRVVFENSFAAFDALSAEGVWGIEFDVRWTRDLEPVVLHDPDLDRVFGDRDRLAELSFEALRSRWPLIPTLGEIIRRYAGRFHLMLELKAEDYPQPGPQQARLLELLARLRPAEDFHILALDTTLFEHVQGLPPACWLPVARTNVAAMSDFAIERGCAGLAAPYALVTKDRIRRHAAAGQAVGVGFPAHRNVLYRELNRGVTWVFSNRALRLQQLVNRLRTEE